MSDDDSTTEEDTDGLHRFEQALRAWLSEAEAYLATLPNGGLQLLWRDEEWQLDPDGIYRHHSIGRVGHDPRETVHVMQFESYQQLRDAAIASPVVAKHLDTLVGTTSSRTRMELRNLALAALPGDLMSPTTGGAQDVGSRVQRVIDFLRRTEFESVTYSPLAGLSLECDQLELEPGLTIERMTPQEVCVALDCHVISQPIPASLFQLSDDRAFALKSAYSSPKIIGDNPTVAVTADDSQRSSKPEELLQCLALMTSQRVEAPGSLSIQTKRMLSGFGVSWQHRSMGRGYGTGLKLNDEQCAELQRIWRVSHDTQFQQNKAVALAIRRLGFGIQRDRVEDRLIDVFIAAEALYLTDGSGEVKERGELRYRLALRAAVWSEGALDGWTRREVFKHMKAGYDLRSAVAHGSNPKPEDIKLRGKRVALQEFVTVTEAIVRAGLLKVVDQIEPGKRFSIAWDDLILPEEAALDSASTDIIETVE